MILPLIRAKVSPQIGRIASWQSAQSTLIHVGGLEIASWLTTGSLADNAAGRTFIEPSRAVRQNCYLTCFKITTRTRKDANQTWSFVLYRYNGATYDLVAKQDFTPLIDGQVNIVTLSPPILAQVGDIPGVYLPDGSGSNTIWYGTVSARDPVLRYVNDITPANSNFPSSTGNTVHGNWEVYTTAPYLAITGDSIAEGHGAGLTNHGGLHTDSGLTTQPYLVAAADPGAQLRARVGNVLKYQNLALGGAYMSWVLSTGIVESLLVKPNTVIIHADVNDVANAHTWASVLSALNSILTLVNAATPIPRLLVGEILPWTNGSDAESATLRTFNSNLAAWCTANGAILVLCHDAMGQVRISTGELDDMKAAYNQDGIHLSVAGVSALAAIWKLYL
jgi:lysophospholipase L1-like esterase